MNPAFDTHKAVKDLTNAGADEKLAEATVATINTAINEQAATKDDIKVVREDIKDIRGDIKDIQGDIKDIRGDITDIQGDIKDIRGDITDIQGDIKDIRGDITDMQGDIKDIQEKLEDVQERMATKTDLELLSKSMTIRLGLMLFAVAAVMIALFNATN